MNKLGAVASDRGSSSGRDHIIADSAEVTLWRTDLGDTGAYTVTRNPRFPAEGPKWRDPPGTASALAPIAVRNRDTAGTVISPGGIRWQPAG